MFDQALFLILRRRGTRSRVRKKAICLLSFANLWKDVGRVPLGKAQCNERNLPTDPPHLGPPALARWEKWIRSTRHCLAAFSGGSSFTQDLSGYLVHVCTLISLLFRREREGEDSLWNFIVSQFASHTLAFYLHAQILPFHLPTNPRLCLLHFCTILLSPPGPQRGQRRAKEGLFLEVWLSFFFFFFFYLPPIFHTTAGNLPPDEESEFQVSLRLCWLWCFVSVCLCCSGIFRMGRTSCNCVILSQHASVTPDAFVLTSLQSHQKSQRGKWDIQLTLLREHHVLRSSVGRETPCW